MSECGRYASNAALLRAAREGDEAALDELVKLNMGLVKKLACKFTGRGTEYEDLVQIGSMGMLKAIRTYDEERGTAFSTYAVPLIIGEIRKFLRDDGPIKVSRAYKKAGAMLLAQRERYISEKGSEPTIGRLASLCGMSPEEAAVCIEAASPVRSLYEHVYGEEDGVTLESVIPDGAEQINKVFDRIALGEAISKMPEFWQKIVLLRYFRDYTQQMCAEALGISQVKISREEKKIFEYLKTELS